MTENSCPVWLLDVDGVINVDKVPWPGRHVKRTAYSNYEAFKFLFSADLVNRIGILIRAHEVEVRWATTWAEDCQQLESMFGWPSLRPVLLPEECNRNASGPPKCMAANHVLLEEERPLIWTDDEWAYPQNLGSMEISKGDPHEAAYSWERDSLLISPRGQVGLLPGHMDMIEGWLNSVREADIARRVKAQLKEGA